MHKAPRDPSHRPRILFDARWILIENRFDGVSRYSYELAHALAAREDIQVDWLIHDKRQLDKLPAGNYLLANDPATNPLAELFTLAHRINRAGYALVYSPFFVMGSLGKRYRLVLTIHDMIYFTHTTPPQWLPWHTRVGWRLFHLTYWPMRLQLNRAHHVATVSATAREELLDARATKRNITVVSNAVSNTFAESNGHEHWRSRRIVYMGAVTPYKNAECLIDALLHLPDEYTLALCGKIPPARMPELVEFIAVRGLTERVTLHDGTTDEEYKLELSNALCSASASLAEGFGLPIIEAQQRGVPFVAADTPIFHEVGQDSVLYFDPKDPEEFARAVQTLTDKQTSQQLITRGHTNAARYTWSNSAEAAAAICANLAD